MFLRVEEALCISGQLTGHDSEVVKTLRDGTALKIELYFNSDAKLEKIDQAIVLQNIAFIANKYILL